MLSGSLRLEDQLSHLLRTIMGRLLVTRALVAIARENRYQIAGCRGIATLKRGDFFDPADAHRLGLPHVETIGDNEAPLGLMAFGDPMRGPLERDEREFIRALLSLAATSIANAQAHDEVIRRNQELRALLDLVRGFTAALHPDEVAHMLMLTLAGRWAVRKHALFTWKPDVEPLRRVKGLDHLNEESLKQLLEKIEDPFRDDDLVFFPIRNADQTIGVAVLGPRPTSLHYSDADLEFGAGLVGQAAVALDNAWRIQDTLYRQQLERELSLAATIQQDLFPKALPELPFTRLGARNRQARQVGGDYYDVLPMIACGGNHPYLMTVADISGKGIAASLLMANIQATLRALLASESDLAAITGKTNELLYASTPSSKYATAILVEYDPHTGQGVYVNGGHNEGVLLRASGEVEMLGATGLPIGLLPKRTFESAAFQMNPGDLLLIYSDGVPESCQIDDTEFGMERVIEVLKLSQQDPPEQILDRLFSSIDTFVGDAPQHDDITAMVIQRRSE